MGPQQLWGPWLLICSPVASHSPPMLVCCSGDQWLMAGQWYVSAQLVSCTSAAAEAWAGCEHGSQALVRVERDSGSWHVTFSQLQRPQWHQVQVYVSSGSGDGKEAVRDSGCWCGTCVTSPREICRTSTAIVLTIGFMSGEICLGFLQNRSLNHSCFCYTSINNSLCFSSLFLADLTHLSFAVLVGLK